MSPVHWLSQDPVQRGQDVCATHVCSDLLDVFTSRGQAFLRGEGRRRINVAVNWMLKINDLNTDNFSFTFTFMHLAGALQKCIDITFQLTSCI